MTPRREALRHVVAILAIAAFGAAVAISLHVLVRGESLGYRGDAVVARTERMVGW